MLTGTPSVFVRASGCNLRCWYCDTPFASWSPEGADLAIEEIVEQVLAYGVQHVVITGGEPMLFAEMIPLCDQLKGNGCHITIETAGTLYLPVRCDLMSISPKMSNSTPDESAGTWRQRHERTRFSLHAMQQLLEQNTYQLKFVVDTPDDLPEILEFVETVRPDGWPAIDPHRIWLMPQGMDPDLLREKEQWLLPYCQSHGFRFCPRKHIEWFGMVRGT